MPVYCFQCYICGGKQDEILPIDRRNDCQVCRSCQSTAAIRDLTGEHVASSNQDYATPILSEAMGVAPNQVAEHRRLHPSIPMTDDGRVIVNNHAEHKRIMKELGFHDNKGFN